jgi:hypothetical protein
MLSSNCIGLVCKYSGCRSFIYVKAVNAYDFVHTALPMQISNNSTHSRIRAKNKLHQRTPAVLLYETVIEHVFIVQSPVSSRSRAYISLSLSKAIGMSKRFQCCRNC